MKTSWKDSIYLQREELARILREPMGQLAERCAPAWGFLLSDAHISLLEHRPSLTALQVVSRDSRTLGYLAADFDLRNLPVTAELYEEPGYWRQVKGDPAIRSTGFQQHRVESQMDRN